MLVGHASSRTLQLAHMRSLVLVHSRMTYSSGPHSRHGWHTVSFPPLHGSDAKKGKRQAWQAVHCVSASSLHGRSV
jgi:hypothetical protein